MIAGGEISSLPLHFAGNIMLFFLYFIFAISFYAASAKQKFTNHPFVVSVSGVFLLFAVVFLFNSFAGEPWRFIWLEVCWFVIALIPACLFMVLSRKWLKTERESRNSAERFNQLKDEFLTVASHELRTPLSVINGFAEILVREKLGGLNEEQKRRVRKILMQGQRLHRIIDDLLDLSRIRSGKIEVKNEVFALVPVLKAALDDHEVLCDQQRIELKDQIPDELPDVCGDLERVTQIVVNLLNNAIKYTEPGGSVTLIASCDRNRGHVMVEVKDTGLGIDPKDQQHVFEEFFRSSQQGTRKLSGSGLGLAIVKQLVEAQGGRVGVESPGLGQGSRFYFTLPIANEAPDPKISSMKMSKKKSV
ncbi:MAG: HAMP domain-containing histidine kinase [Candidatus Omnitrophica bacterium]|nr:HAMP domain-containing histidine kinase [Candidatus Omnitrophota bacterium]